MRGQGYELGWGGGLTETFFFIVLLNFGWLIPEFLLVSEVFSIMMYQNVAVPKTARHIFSGR